MRAERALEAGGRFALGAALLVLLAGCALVPLRPRGSWLLAHTPHFEIASGLSAHGTREIALELERARDAALAWSELEDRRSTPALVVVFPRENHLAALRPRRALRGLFVQSAHKSFLLIDASAREESLRIARHELVHLLQSENPELPMPAWYREGFADLLSTAASEGDAYVIGRAPSDHQALARAAPLPLGSVLEEADALRVRSRALPAFYAQAWALAHYFHLGVDAPRSGLPRFLALLANGRSAEEASAEALARPLAQLEADVLRHVERDELPLAGGPLAAAAPLSIALRPLPDAERDALLGDLALSLGEPRWHRAERWLRAALASDPALASAHASLAWLLASRGRPEAAAQLALAERARPQDRDSEWRLGDAWYALAVNAPAGDARREAVERAQTHYERSLSLDASQLGARLGLARIALAHGQAERAARELAAAERARPAEPSLALELARLQLEAGQPELARAPLQRLLASPLHARPSAAPATEPLEPLLRAAGLELPGPSAARHLAARLDVLDPAAGEPRSTDLAWFEIKGKAGLWEAPLQDLAIALDVSNSTLDASGVDVDQDGRTGQTRRVGTTPATNPLAASSDRDDSIVRAELAAAQRLVGELDADTTRVALVLFTARAKLAARLGAPRDTLAALARHRVHYDPTGTSFEAPLRAAFAELLERREPERRSQRTILMLSDGEPTAPSRLEARSQALALADELARYGVRVHGFALGERALDVSDTLREIAERTGGRFSAVANLADVSFLQRAQLAGLEAVSLRNARSGEPARALRVFADGSFDGFVPLVPGANEIEIRAQVAGHAPLEVRRTLLFAPPANGSAEPAQRTAELLRVLRERTREIALRAELERSQGERRSLAVDVAAPPQAVSAREE